MLQKECQYSKTLEIFIHNLWRKIYCPMAVYDISKVPGEKYITTFSQVSSTVF